MMKIGLWKYSIFTKLYGQNTLRVENLINVFTVENAIEK